MVALLYYPMIIQHTNSFVKGFLKYFSFFSEILQIHTVANSVDRADIPRRILRNGELMPNIVYVHPELTVSLAVGAAPERAQHTFIGYHPALCTAQQLNDSVFVTRQRNKCAAYAHCAPSAIHCKPSHIIDLFITCKRPACFIISAELS